MLWVWRAVLAWAVWRLFGPRRTPDFGVPQEKPLHLPGRTVFAGEREYFVREAGPPDGEPLLLLPGWGADALFNWFGVMPLLAERRRVLALDLRSHGKSDRVWEPYRIDDVADEVAGVIDALGMERATVAGYSMGGMVAQVLARRHPEKVERLVLAATAARVPLRARRLRRAAILAGRAFERLSATAATRQRLRYLLRMGAIEPRHARWAWEHFMTRDPTLFYGAGLAAMDFDSRAWVGEVDHPALVIVCHEDVMIPPDAQWGLAEALPGAEVVELAGAGHEACFTHREEVAKAMLEFLG